MSFLTNTSAAVTGDAADASGDDRHSLQTYIGDLLALTKHIEVPVDRHLAIDDSANYAEALAVFRTIKAVLDEQRGALEAHLDRLGGDRAAGLKSAWSSLLGAGAAAVGSLRTTKVSKNLRDDYTALGLASISYTMLHATALGLGDQATAALAQRHLGAITPIIIEISKVMPAVVLQELRDDGEAVSTGAADISARQTHAAWQPN